MIHSVSRTVKKNVAKMRRYCYDHRHYHYYCSRYDYILLLQGRRQENNVVGTWGLEFPLLLGLVSCILGFYHRDGFNELNTPITTNTTAAAAAAAATSTTSSGSSSSGGGGSSSSSGGSSSSSRSCSSILHSISKNLVLGATDS